MDITVFMRIVFQVASNHWKGVKITVISYEDLYAIYLPFQPLHVIENIFF